MTKGRHTGIRRIVHALRYSWEGFTSAFREEAAFRQELLLLVAGVPAALLLGSSAAERALLIGSLLLVLVVELLNTAIESAVNLASPTLHPLAKRAKDCGSAAVLVALLNAATLWIIILAG